MLSPIPCRSLKQASVIMLTLGAIFLVGLHPVASAEDSGLNEKGQSIEVLPAELTLQGTEGRHRLLVQKVVDAHYRGVISSELKWQSSNDQIVRVDQGSVIPVSNGTALVTVTSGNLTATARVTVKGMNAPHQWSFRNHVLPVLAKAGCNSGACHGALSGKGGFKLSLRGYDPASDHHAITRQARGRRIELGDPARSLLLVKPTGTIAHKGGVRLPVGSHDYRVASEWIASGAPAPQDNDARVTKVEILPDSSLLQPGDRQQVLVRAHYSNGRVEDVTQWAKFSSTDEAVAKVNEKGDVTVIGHGVGAITAWFSSRIVIARVTSPYSNNIDPAVFARAERMNFIDDFVLRKLEELKIPPSPECSDASFVRRVFVDTIGVLPARAEVEMFMRDDHPDKRNKLIESLLSRPEFVDYWTYKWSDLLLLSGQKLRPAAVKSYYQWISGHVAQNTPWDQFVREIVTSQGSSLKNGATNFFALHQDPENMSENVSQAFMGLSIACAKCHNHPLEKWTNDQYYAMANLFSRVRAKGWGGDLRSGDGNRTLYVTTTGELIQPLRGRPQPPTPLDGQPVAFDDRGDRRIHLANWLTSPENPYFTRSITNRIWANFFGVGLVEQVDDMRVSNPASNEDLLSAVAQFLSDNGFNVKALMRAILQSETYQRSSAPLPGNADEQRFYSRYYPRRMMAEVLLDAISDVTQVATEFKEIEFPGADRSKTDFYRPGTRAVQLYDSAVSSYFLKSFGRNPRQITCECERSDEPSMVQVLHITNGDTVNLKLAAKDNRIAKMILDGTPLDQLIDEAFLVALARHPTVREKEELTKMIGDAGDKDYRLKLEDMFWGIISSREFLFNH